MKILMCLSSDGVRVCVFSCVRCVSVCEWTGSSPAVEVQSSDRCLVFVIFVVELYLLVRCFAYK